MIQNEYTQLNTTNTEQKFKGMNINQETWNEKITQ